MSRFSFTPEGGRAYAEMQAAGLTLPADIRDLASGDLDDDLLAAADRDPQLPGRVVRAAHAAWINARGRPLADWEQLDWDWRRLTPQLLDLQFPYGNGPPYTASENAIRVRVVRAALVALEHFQRVAVPVMSAADKLAAQPIHTAVRAARMGGAIHPLEPQLPGAAAPEPARALDAPQPPKRRSAA